MNKFLPWITWGLASLIFLMGTFHRIAPGVLAKDFMESFHATGTLLGLLSSMYFYAYGCLLLPAGVLVDTYGPKRLVTLSGLFMGFGTLLMSWTGNVPLLLIGRFLIGVGASAAFVCALKLAGNWFAPGQFGFLSTLTAGVGNIGTLLATSPLALLIGLVGWRHALAWVGGITLVTAMLCGLGIRDRPATAQHHQRAPAVPLRHVIRGVGRVLKNPATWPPVLTFLALYSWWGNLLLWSVPCLRDIYGLTTAQAAKYALMIPLGLLIAAPLMGYLSDQVFQRRRPLYIGSCWSALGMWIIFLLTLGYIPPWMLYGLFFVIGLSGSSSILTWAIGKEVNHPELLGVSVSTVNMAGFLGGAISQSVVGMVLDTQWTGTLVHGVRLYPLSAYRVAFGLCGIFILGAALLTLKTRETYCQHIYSAG